MKNSVKILAVAITAMALATACHNKQENTTIDTIDTTPIETVVEEVADTVAEEVAEAVVEQPVKKAPAKKVAKKTETKAEEPVAKGKDAVTVDESGVRIREVGTNGKKTETKEDSKSTEVTIDQNGVRAREAKRR